MRRGAQGASAQLAVTVNPVFDFVTAARRTFGVSVDLSWLGPGRERLAAAMVLLIHSAGGAAGGGIFDVTKHTLPFPTLPDNRTPGSLDKYAWQQISAARFLWISAWEGAERIRHAEHADRDALAADRSADRIAALQAQRLREAAFRMIGSVEADIRSELVAQQELVREGLQSRFRTRKSEIAIAETLSR